MEKNTGFIGDGNDSGEQQTPINASATEAGKNEGEQFIEPSPDADESNQGKDGPSESAVEQDAAAKSPKWKAQVRDDLKQNEVLDQYGDLNALADAHLALMDGKSGEVAVPADDDAEAWGELYNKLGRPEKSDDYQLSESITLPENVEKAIKDTAHEMGLNQTQFDKLTSVMGDTVEYDKALQAAQYKGTAAEAEQMLKSEWGEKFEERREFMKRGAKELLSPELRKVLGLHNQLNNPEIAKALASYGEYISDDVPANGSASGSEESGWKYPD